jgi:hypothetical protein
MILFSADVDSKKRRKVVYKYAQASKVGFNRNSSSCDYPWDREEKNSR